MLLWWISMISAFPRGSWPPTPNLSHSIPSLKGTDTLSASKFCHLQRLQRVREIEKDSSLFTLHSKLRDIKLVAPKVHVMIVRRLVKHGCVAKENEWTLACDIVEQHKVQHSIMTMWCVWVCASNCLVVCFNVKTCDIREGNVYSTCPSFEHDTRVFERYRFCDPHHSCFIITKVNIYSNIYLIFNLINCSLMIFSQ